MSAEKDLPAAVVVTIIGLGACGLIPSQVSMEPVPGSMGFSKVGPATLPILTAWALTVTGVAWLGAGIWRFRKHHRRKDWNTGSVPGSAGQDLHERWGRSMLVWLGMVAYVALTPALGFSEASMAYGVSLALAMAHARRPAPARHFVFGLLIGVVLFPLVVQFLFYRFFYVALPTGLVSQFLIAG